MYVNRMIRHGWDLLHTMPLPLQTLCSQGPSIGKCHIRDGRGSGIVQAVWEERIGDFDLIILTETNTNDQVYCFNRTGYDMVCLKAITKADRKK